jgi:hypothetical protein
MTMPLATATLMKRLIMVMMFRFIVIVPAFINSLSFQNYDTQRD